MGLFGLFIPRSQRGGSQQVKSRLPITVYRARAKQVATVIVAVDRIAAA